MRAPHTQPRRLLVTSAAGFIGANFVHDDICNGPLVIGVGL